MKENGIPISLRRIHDATLGNAAAAIPSVIAHHIPAGKLTLRGIRHKAGLRPPPRLSGHVNKENIILPINLIKMRSLIAQIGIVPVFYDNPVKSALLRPAEVRRKLRQMHLPVAIDNIHPAVIVKEQGIVMVEALDLALLPRSLNILCPVQIGLMGVIGHKDHIIHSLMIP